MVCQRGPGVATKLRLGNPTLVWDNGRTLMAAAVVHGMSAFCVAAVVLQLCPSFLQRPVGHSVWSSFKKRKEGRERVLPATQSPLCGAVVR